MHTDSSRCSLLDVDEDRWAVIILIRVVMSSREGIHLDHCTPGETKRKCMCVYVYVYVCASKWEEEKWHEVAMRGDAMGQK